MALKIEGSNPFIHPMSEQGASSGGVLSGDKTPPFAPFSPFPSCRRRTVASIGMSPSGKAPDFDSGIRRFESCHPSHDPLAQLAEQLPFKQWVWSSNLQRVTK